MSSLLFTDFSQLLRLGEQTGLTSGARIRELLPDLAKIRAIGLSSASGEQRHDHGATPRDPMKTLSDNEYLFTSESVTEGHPDKVADQISDGVLDAVLRDDPNGRVACETLVNTGLVDRLRARSRRPRTSTSRTSRARRSSGSATRTPSTGSTTTRAR